MNISERRKLLGIIKTATTGKDVTLDEIIQITMPQGYSEISVIRYINVLSRHVFLKPILITKSDKFTDAKFSYRWVE
jgi:hypothetical protein